jgi:hypothetical protein
MARKSGPQNKLKQEAKMKLYTRIQKLSLPLLIAAALSPAMLFAGNSQKATTEHGIVKTVDMSAHTLTVVEKKSRAESTFQWNDKTTFTHRRKTASANALKDGETVEITFAPGGKMPTLKSVAILPAKNEKRHAHQSSSNRNHKATT